MRGCARRTSHGLVFAAGLTAGVAGGLAGGLGGCQVAGPRGSERAYLAEASRGGLPAGGIFAPTRMRIHPLSRADEPAGVEPRIVLHIEFEDRYAHRVKAAGAMQIKLIEPDSRRSVEGVARLWVPALDDPEANSALYDATTQTYRIELGGLPAWAQAYVRGGSELAGLPMVVQYEGLDAAGDAFGLSARGEVRR